MTIKGAPMTNKFVKVPPHSVAEFLSSKDLSALTQASKKTHTLFKPMLKEQLLERIFDHVVRDEYADLIVLLENNLNFLVKRGTVTDCSGRTFKSISPFEYALWALDQPMWELMLHLIVNHSKELLPQVLAQYNKMKTDGVSYTLNGEEIPGELHFDAENTIIKQLHVQAANETKSSDIDAQNEQWIKGVGGAQKLLPMNFVHEYCNEEVPFYPLPEFNSQQKSSQQFVNCTTQLEENWFNPDSKLGVEIALTKDDISATKLMGINLGPGAGAQIDLDAIKALYKTRLQGLSSLKTSLEQHSAELNGASIKPK
jgi:hypothetical protein